MSKSERKDSSQKSPKNEFLVVGVGASAGGIQALKEFFVNVPADSGAAYVVILHLSPDHDSQLAEIIKTATEITVTKITKKVKVEPNHIYVISPNESISMSDGHIIVSPIETVEERRAPVDIFFQDSRRISPGTGGCRGLIGNGCRWFDGHQTN
ncbi:MAG: hypothetical protein M3405_08850 [Acidobacteriota bacterium]|jgi:two-component system CheB/CheR fusion protein|nr:hypothetical protein [Acidobacteriota bacterium]